jgi:hypothetical protein
MEGSRKGRTLSVGHSAGAVMQSLAISFVWLFRPSFLWPLHKKTLKIFYFQFSSLFIIVQNEANVYGCIL